MTISRGLSSAVIFAGVAAGLAGPAWADPATPAIEGNYAYTGAGITRPWNATSCGVGCTHIEAPPVPGKAGFNGDALLAYGGWALTLVSMPDTVVCRDGSSAPGNITYRWNWDAGTLSGWAN